METRISIFLLSCGLCVVPFVACSSSSSSGATKTASAAVVAGAADSHCTKTVTVDPAQCKATPADTDGGDTDGGGGADGGDTGGSDFGATMYGGEGDDDDCKYHVKWSASAGVSGSDFAEVDFTVAVTTKVDGKALAGVPIDIEALDANDKPPLNTTSTTKETTPGTYVVPVRFAPTASGKWTIRFHIHDDCNDTEESPHGHAAFFVQIAVQ